MDGYLLRRVGDRRFGSGRVDMGHVRSTTIVTPWYTSSNTKSVPTKQDQLTVTKHTASAGSAGITKKKYTFAETAKKRRPKSKGSGSESYSSSSESDGGGGRKSKKSGRCWKGYEPTPGKKAYSDGSCRKK